MKKYAFNQAVVVSVRNYEDVILARQTAREIMQEMGFSLLDQTRIVTAVSELARNMVVHAGKGQMTAEALDRSNQKGIRCVFEDQGPGIANVEQAMKEGFSTTNSLGLGLSGARNLSKEFEIQSQIGKGTKVTITEWLRRI